LILALLPFYVSYRVFAVISNHEDQTSVGTETREQDAAPPPRKTLRQLPSRLLHSFGFVGHQLHGNAVIDNMIYFINSGLYVGLFAFCADEACFQLSGYISSQNRRIRSAKNPRMLRENPLHSSESVFSVHCPETELWGYCSLNRLGVWVAEGGVHNQNLPLINTKFVTFLLSLKK
jgi:hypothetical protein